LIQLELFPRARLEGLGDFQKLAENRLSTADKRTLISHLDFFKSPRPNDVVRRQHAGLIDRILGFRVKYVEEMLIAEARNFDPDGGHETWGPLMHQGAQTWVGLERETLQTPYSECFRILQLLKIRPYQHIVDLGAAYGRMGVVIGGLYVKNSFTGFELVKARVDEGNRIYRELGLQRCQLIAQDLARPDFELPEADVYFIYDYGQVSHIDHTLRQIQVVAGSRPLKVVARGKFAKQIIEARHPWLEVVYQGRNEEFFSIYSGLHTSTEPGF
jgi:hypothetical protein